MVHYTQSLDESLQRTRSKHNREEEKEREKKKKGTSVSPVENKSMGRNSFGVLVDIFIFQPAHERGR